MSDINNTMPEGGATPLMVSDDGVGLGSVKESPTFEDKQASIRAEKIAAQIAAQIASQRRLPKPEHFLYDRSSDSYWDTVTMTGGLSAAAVDASISREYWRVIIEEAPEPVSGEPARRGPKARTRERLIEPSKDIRRIEHDQFVEGTIWWPGMEKIVKDWMVRPTGELWELHGARLLNTYTPPPDAAGGVARNADLWIDHVKRLFPESEEHEYFFDWCAHLLQKPSEKCNTGIVLCGDFGIGKDAALWPLRAAVGSWNMKGITPNDVFSPYNPWVGTLLLVIDEVRPTKDDFQASSFYNILKPYLAAPPDTLPVNDKYIPVRYVKNLMRVLMTTNDPMSMFIPSEDRRLFIMQSKLSKGWHLAAGDPNYFKNFFDWSEDGGWKHVAAWLAERDISAFNPKAESPKTPVKDSIAGSWAVDDDDAVGFALEKLMHPEAVFVRELVDAQFDRREEMERLRGSSRKLALRMEKAGYRQVPHPEGAERWRFPVVGVPSGYRSGKAYARQNLNPQDALAAVTKRGEEIAARMAKQPSLSVVS